MSDHDYVPSMNPNDAGDCAICGNSQYMHTTRSDLCVTREEADAAVALALEGAALRARKGIWALPHYEQNTENNLADKVEEGYGNACVNIEAAILALIPTSGTDALSRMRREAHNAAIEAAASLPAYDGDGDPSGTFDHRVFVRIDAIATLALPVDGGPQG